MPTYQYRCLDCSLEHEVVQRFSDAPLTQCPDPDCEGSLRKVYSPVGVVFKGSGFYATDNRTKGKANAAAAPVKDKPATDSPAAPAPVPASSTGGSSAA